MMERQGQVKAISNRDFNSVKLWSFQLEGSNRYFRTGKTDPGLSEGQWIKFSESNGIVDDVEAIQVIEKGSIQDVPAGAVAPPVTVAATNVGERIRYQAARRDASNIVIAALHTDHLPHAVNVAKGKRLDLLLQYVEEVTHSLLEQEDAA